MVTMIHNFCQEHTQLNKNKEPIYNSQQETEMTDNKMHASKLDKR